MKKVHIFYISYQRKINLMPSWILITSHFKVIFYIVGQNIWNICMQHPTYSRLDKIPTLHLKQTSHIAFSSRHCLDVPTMWWHYVITFLVGIFHVILGDIHCNLWSCKPQKTRIWSFKKLVSDHWICCLVTKFSCAKDIG